MTDAAPRFEESAVGEPRDRRGVRRHVADPQPGSNRLREGAEPDDRSRTSHAPERWWRRAVVAQLSIRVILDDQDALPFRQRHQLPAPPAREAESGWVVEGRHGVQNPGSTAIGANPPDGVGHGVDSEAATVRPNGNQLDRMVAQELDGKVVGRRLDQCHVAGVHEEGGDLVEALRAPRRDDHLIGRRGSCVYLRQTRPDHLYQGRRPSRPAVAQGIGTVTTQRPIGCRSQGHDRQESRVGVSPGQLGDAGPFHELHE
jgi:hypothetical protein